jgi:hypothetical protein
MEKNSSTQPARSIASGRGSPAMRVAVALLLAWTIAACGLVKVGYRNGDTVGLFMIDRYLDLDGDQKDFVRPRLHQLLVWHRSTQLPDYVSFGQSLQRRALQPITTAEIEGLSDDAKRRANTTVQHALPDLADLALRLTPDNIKALRDKFADDTKKWKKEHMTGDVEHQQEARYEKTLDRVEEWYGRFSDAQRQRIRQLSDARPFDNQLVVAERQRRQQELVALLTQVERDKPPRDAVIAAMKSYADRFEINPDPARRAFLDSLRHATEAMDAEIHNLSTVEQRQRAIAKLQDWIDDFRSLSADPG